MWAMVVLAGVVGFLGPFGSYLAGDFIERLWRWSLMLMGTYVLVRPAVLACAWLERATHLPRNFLVLMGTVSSSVPLAFIWFAWAPRETKALGSVSALVPFTLLCAIAVIIVVSWAERTDARMREFLAHGAFDADFAPASAATASPSVAAPAQPAGDVPRLRARLSRGFDGEILALESEDHYVRVHGRSRSELLLIRLREAILEMDGVPGEQTHRSWWVASSAIAECLANGRNRELRLTNGLKVPVARDSIQRLQRSGFLSG